MPKEKRNSRSFSIQNEPLYPHIKLTNERFPRVLATRLIADDAAEYFGAFLNRTNVRILLDFLNKTFRLRSCEIDIDGSFSYPCTMHYRRRCLAPCVAEFIDHEQYHEMVALVRLFLLNDRPLFRSVTATKIETASESLEFETAAKWRDILDKVEEFWRDTRHTVWLDGTSDTYFVRSTETGLDVFLISQKGRRVLGERVFAFAGTAEADEAQALSEVIEQFYRLHAPKEIRVAVDLPRRAELQKDLSATFGRRVPIVLLNEKNRKISTELAVYRSSAELDVRRSVVTLNAQQLRKALKKDFRLRKTPQKIFAIDASHISGMSTVVAMIGRGDGKVVESDYWVADISGEPAALTAFLKSRSQPDEIEPALLLIDGGASQLNAAIKADLPRSMSIIAAVKPPGEHSAVSHFLTINGRIEYDVHRVTHRFLHRLRDDVHEFANAVHRDVRDFANFYKKVPPLVVPTSLQDPNGAADDLIPIEATSRKPKRRKR